MLSRRLQRIEDGVLTQADSHVRHAQLRVPERVA